MNNSLTSSWRRLDVRLEGKADSQIAIEDASAFLKNLQLLINHIGEYLTGSDFRGRGRSPDFVRDRCQLVFKHVTIHSFEATLALGDAQDTMFPETTLSLGQETIKKFSDLVETITESGEIETPLKRMIDQTLHRNRIIEDMVKLWPEEKDSFRVNLKLSDQRFVQLEPARKYELEGLLSRVSREPKTVKGVLGTVTVAPLNKMMKVSGPDGNVKIPFTKEEIEKARKLLGRPVIIYGEASFDADGNIEEMTNISSIKEFTTITLNRILSAEGELKLAQPLDVSIDYEDDAWLMKCDDLGIVTADRDYDEAMKEFYEDFVFKWKEYGNAKDEELTQGARNLRDKIRAYLGMNGKAPTPVVS